MAARVLLNRPSGCQGFVGTSLVVVRVLLELAWWPPGSCWTWLGGYQGLVGIALVGLVTCV